MYTGRIRTATPLTDTRGITSLALVMATADRDTKNGLTTPTGLNHTRTGGIRLGPVTVPSVRGRAIGPPGRERIAPAPVTVPSVRGRAIGPPGRERIAPAPVTVPSVRGRAIGPPGRERIAPAPVDNDIRSEGNRVLPAAKGGGDLPVWLTTCCFRPHLWMDTIQVIQFSETGQSKALDILLGVDAVAVAT